MTHNMVVVSHSHSTNSWDSGMTSVAHLRELGAKIWTSSFPRIILRGLFFKIWYHRPPRSIEVWLYSDNKRSMNEWRKHESEDDETWEGEERDDGRVRNKNNGGKVRRIKGSWGREGKEEEDEIHEAREGTVCRMREGWGRVWFNVLCDLFYMCTLTEIQFVWCYIRRKEGVRDWMTEIGQGCTPPPPPRRWISTCRRAGRSHAGVQIWDSYTY